MQFRAPPLRKTQVDPRRIFHVHIQTAEVFRPASHFRGPPQQPANVIQFVRAVENDAPAQFVTRAVAFAIVLPGTPVGKVLPRLRVEPEHAPDLSRIDQLLHNLQAGMKPHVVADLHVPAAAARLGNQRLDSTRFVRERFLDKNVRLSTQRGQRLLHVVHRRGTDQYDIRLELRQRLVIVAEDLPVQLFTALLQRFGAGVAKAKLPHPKRLEISCVPAANRTATDYQNPISCPVGNCGHEVILIAWSRAHASARLSLALENQPLVVSR